MLGFTSLKTGSATSMLKSKYNSTVFFLMNTGVIISNNSRWLKLSRILTEESQIHSHRIFGVIKVFPKYPSLNNAEYYKICI